MRINHSIVVPVYNEAPVLAELYSRLTKVLEDLSEPYEIIFVNDGSNDESLQLLRSFRENDSRVKFLSFSRNFGHQAAITAGLDHSCGEAVVVMDADLQDPPEIIPALIEKWREGYDVVFAVREKRRGESFFKEATAWLYYRFLSLMSGTEIPLDAGDFRLMSRRATLAMRSIRERYRFIRGLAGWVGFKQATVTFRREPRYAGETKYAFRKMIKFALDGITSFSYLPLHFATYLGLCVSAASFIYILYAVVLKVFTDTLVLGWASVIVSVLFIGGVQLITLGIIGEYIGRIYEEVKRRPLYLLEEAAGFEFEENGFQGYTEASGATDDRHTHRFP